MDGVMVSVATGVMTSVVDKLTTLLGGEYMLSTNVRHGIRFMRDELRSMNTALQVLADMDDDQIDLLAKEWRSKVRELSYDIEDCIDRFMFLHSSEKAKLNFVQSMVQKIKILWEDRKIAKEIQELKALVVEEKERRDRYNIDQYVTVTKLVLLDPRAPAMYDEARDLVGIDGPREEIIGWLRSEERQLKVVSIFGIGGQGKTTLAMEVYRKIDEPFDCRASVTVSRTLDLKKLLRDILFQINKREYERSEGWGVEQLILTLREHLMDKRYLIIVDDIWSVSAWEHVKSALPDNNNRSRIITTTRIKDVAKSCCTSVNDHMYEAKPLSEDDSSTLFFRRTFRSSEDCPQELKEVANDILKKCGGLPLAIISIAGLLANKSPCVEVWNNIRKSISSAVEKDSSLDKMKRILFFSYFDLPHHLKSCLLYLSIFPEDHSIDSRDLIWMWAAEGLIPRQNGESTEQLGRNYLHELINRSMIQATKIGADGKTVKLCRVHDVVLDFIVSRAGEDNFVTVLNGNIFHGNSSNKIRRLSIQTGFSEAAEVAKAIVGNGSSHIRSLHLFGYFPLEELGKQSPQLWNNQALRVLNLERLDEDVEQIGSFSRLKALQVPNLERLNHSFGITRPCKKLPEQIGNLQYLETLDLRGCLSMELPANIVQLQKLVRLFVNITVALPDGIGNMQALEELSCFNLDKASAESIHALGELTKLRVLGMYYYDAMGVEAKKNACVSSLSILVTCRLRSLSLQGPGLASNCYNSWMVQCGTTTSLQKLVLISTVGPDPSFQIGSFVNLTRLRFSVRGVVGEEGLNILASLPMLVSLTVGIEDCIHIFDVILPRHVIGRQGFQRLVKFGFKSENLAALEFEPGAMPMLQRLKLELLARSQFKYGDGGLVAGLQHLPGLKHIALLVNYTDAVAEEVEALEDDIRVAAGSHPSRPTLEVGRQNEYFMRQRHDHSILESNDRQQSGTVQVVATASVVQFPRVMLTIDQRCAEWHGRFPMNEQVHHWILLHLNNNYLIPFMHLHGLQSSSIRQ